MNSQQESHGYSFKDVCPKVCVHLQRIMRQAEIKSDGFVKSPNIIVDYEEVPVEENLRVAVIMAPMGVAKPYSKRKGKDAKERYYIRDVTRCREADKEELRRLFQSSGVIHFEVTPVPRSKPADLNETLLIEYFRRVRNIGYDDKSKWLRLLMDNQILSEELGAVNCTLAGLILFGKKDRVKRLIPQSGITAVEYDTTPLEAKIASV